MTNSYQIDRILDETIIDQKPHYLIKWKGFSSTDSTWEPIQNLLDELQLVHSWKVKNKSAKMRNEKRKAKIPQSPSMEDEEQQEFSMDYGRKKKSSSRRKLTIDDSNSSNNSLNEFDSQQQSDQLSFCQNMRGQKNHIKKRLRQKKSQANKNESQNRDSFDVNGFKKVGKVTKQDLKAILWCFDWQGDHFCQVLLKDGRKVHMRKADVKKICPEILVEYYEKNEKSHL